MKVIITAIFSTLILCGEYAASRVCRPAQTTLATFNAAIVPFYPGQGKGPAIEERVPLLIEQIESSDVDILCLQEVFFADVQRQIYQNLSQAYPYIYSNIDFEDEFDSTPACTELQLQEFQMKNAKSCDKVIEGFGQQCADCIQLYQPSSEGITACSSNPAGRFETSYGLMLLSRRELTSAQASGYIPQSQFRGYLRATVADVGTVFCTHFTALFSNDIYIGPPIPLQYTNYEQQQNAEITTLFEQLNGVETPILMGDFNNGPASQGENVVYELPFHYGLITVRGFVSPYVLLDGRCTFCTDNPAVSFPNNLIIDHIYLLTDMYQGRVLSSERFFDDVRTASGVELSDHFGVKVTLKDVRSNCRWWEEKRYFCPAPPSTESLELPDLQQTLERLCVVTE